MGRDEVLWVASSEQGMKLKHVPLLAATNFGLQPGVLEDSQMAKEENGTNAPKS